MQQTSQKKQSFASGANQKKSNGRKEYTEAPRPQREEDPIIDEKKVSQLHYNIRQISVLFILTTQCWVVFIFGFDLIRLLIYYWNLS